MEPRTPESNIFRIWHSDFTKYHYFYSSMSKIFIYTMFTYLCLRLLLILSLSLIIIGEEYFKAEGRIGHSEKKMLHVLKRGSSCRCAIESF